MLYIFTLSAFTSPYTELAAQRDQTDLLPGAEFQGATPVDDLLDRFKFGEESAGSGFESRTDEVSDGFSPTPDGPAMDDASDASAIQMTAAAGADGIENGGADGGADGGGNDGDASGIVPREFENVSMPLLNNRAGNPPVAEAVPPASSISSPSIGSPFQPGAASPSLTIDNGDSKGTPEEPVRFHELKTADPRELASPATEQKGGGGNSSSGGGGGGINLASAFNAAANPAPLPPMSFGCKIVYGVASAGIASAVGIGLWIALDPEGSNDFIRSSSSTNEPGHNGGALPQPPLAPTAPETSLTPATPTTSETPVTPNTPDTPDTPDIPNTSDAPVTPELPTVPFTLADGTGPAAAPGVAHALTDLPFIREIVRQWILQFAPASGLSLDGIDVLDPGNGAGVSLMLHLSVHPDPDGFNSALTEASMALPEPALPHGAEWIPDQEHAVTLIGSSVEIGLQ